MNDPYKQREDERAREDDAYAKRRELERRDRQADHAPAIGACKACGASVGTYDVGAGLACSWCGAPVKP